MQTIEDLQSLNRAELFEVWNKSFKTAPPKSLSLSLMRRVLIFECQCRELGGLDKETQKVLIPKKRAISSSDNIHKLPAAKLKTGARLMREWNGITHSVDVIDGGFRWQGSEYKSLSAIAKAITGAHWSGPRFFGLNKKESING